LKPNYKVKVQIKRNAIMTNLDIMHDVHTLNISKGKKSKWRINLKKDYSYKR